MGILFLAVTKENAHAAIAQISAADVLDALANFIDGLETPGVGNAHGSSEPKACGLTWTKTQHPRRGQRVTFWPTTPCTLFDLLRSMANGYNPRMFPQR